MLLLDPATTPTRHTTLPTPVGDLLLTGDGDAITGLYLLPSHRHFAGIGTDWIADASPFRAASTQLAAYFAGELKEFDLPLAPKGTPFQRDVWQALTTIPWGRTTTYGQLAAELGRSPAASRAVGMANGRNPVSIIIPCHRVIGADGALIGYGGGLPAKEFLLTHEGSLPAPEQSLF
ncbi:methylated-DNA--[protein]-cysteine S-methyltransferase [Actinokineospora inagensis]|uniref:methylated-DNA--[protein]-cysteine S-methyltransferase n=1 Tax=Actinokineospora inagensis TaxID=103730 RepID=UPI00040D1DED|nr:methylated-DNA--[protein]-cysteine S-methyltransferase [Actinokineospora inagensis]